MIYQISGFIFKWNDNQCFEHCNKDESCCETKPEVNSLNKTSFAIRNSIRFFEGILIFFFAMLKHFRQKSEEEKLKMC